MSVEVSTCYEPAQGHTGSPIVLCSWVKGTHVPWVKGTHVP